ncbi:MAG: PQQ-binding-like beta-propeller repeat protein [Phycisphaerales bacterium]|nr:PQQ-binding-like beta-propeller repeat protein [Phycisphaerales bacterium]MCB9858562.1 PQQ-binding-like beta-propeller repeat protein [Phycisphaerales bacterium]
MYCLATLLVLASPSLAEEANWPQWRGPTRDCYVTRDAPAWPDNLNSIESRWRVKLGPSYSGPIVWGERIFVTETVDEKYEVVRALDRRTGRELWKTQWEGALSVPFFAKANGDWIRSTPACDGASLYVGGIRDVLVCINVADGKIRWRSDFAEEYGTGPPAFGFVCSPLIDGDDLYVQVASSVMKLDKNTGGVVWRALADDGGMMGGAFSSPVIATIHNKRQLVAQTRTTLAGLDLDSGSVIWSILVPAFRGMNILTPTVVGDRVFTSTYKNQTFMYVVEKTESGFAVSESWTLPAQGYMSSPVVVDGFAYLHLGNGRLSCIDLASGVQKWRSKGFGKYWSMAVNGDKILALDQRGGLILFAANPNEMTILAKKRIADAETWAHIAVVDNSIYIRELNAIAAYQWNAKAE